ncbi:hypothetical protein [Cytobacillus sp. IB215665]|uniref:hypothetical protein n=1 Tax=Cytobacillus sp. IB215665 TaxID=3097357 RepID=UPI002A0AC8EB|nr:hypothetical protein [Cytobacillus sp. IB215665]MDX8367362.1 hypothetical protein [Cytobacillus sp. IB215665]
MDYRIVSSIVFLISLFLVIPTYVSGASNGNANKDLKVEAEIKINSKNKNNNKEKGTYNSQAQKEVLKTKKNEKQNQAKENHKNIHSTKKTNNGKKSFKNTKVLDKTKDKANQLKKIKGSPSDQVVNYSDDGQKAIQFKQSIISSTKTEQNMQERAKSSTSNYNSKSEEQSKRGMLLDYFYVVVNINNFHSSPSSADAGGQGSNLNHQLQALELNQHRFKISQKTDSVSNIQALSNQWINAPPSQPPDLSSSC